MRSRDLARQLQRLESLVTSATDATGDNLELRAHWGRYLAVLVAGFIENAYGTIYSEFAKQAASAPVARHAAATLARVRTPNAQKFVETSGSFNAIWGIELEAFLAEDGLKDAIDGIVAVRHQVAHGQDSGITVARVTDYLERCVLALEYIEEQCNLPNPY